MAGRGKPGPDGKGPRKQYSLRLPVDIYDAVVSQAAREHLPLGDVVANVLADRYGLPHIAEPMHFDHDEVQEELRLKAS